jgi:hypothetical protein
VCGPASTSCVDTCLTVRRWMSAQFGRPDVHTVCIPRFTRIRGCVQTGPERSEKADIRHLKNDTINSPIRIAQKFKNSRRLFINSSGDILQDLGLVVSWGKT